MAERPAQIVDAILASDELRSSIARAVQASSNNAGNTTTGQNSVEEEVRSLFRPGETRTRRQQQVQQSQSHLSVLAPSSSGISPGGLPSTSTGIRGTYPIFQMRRNYTQVPKRRRNAKKLANKNTTFSIKEVILLTSPCDGLVPKQGKKQELYELGHVMNAVEMAKEWGQEEVMAHLSQCFANKINENITVDIMMGCGNKLVKPMLTSEQSFCGTVLAKVFGSKAIYLRPSKDIVTIKVEVESSDDDGDTARPLPVTASDEQEQHQVSSQQGKRKRGQNIVNTIKSSAQHRESTSKSNGCEALYASLVDSDSDDEYNSLLVSYQEEQDVINMAITASLKDCQQNESKDLEEILKDHCDKCLCDEPSNEIIVRRSRFLQTAFTAIQATSFNCCKTVCVKFSGEKGSDVGGPRREFFRLAMNHLPRYSGLFEGPKERMMFAHNIKLVEENKFFLAGRLVGMSLIQGGPGLCCLHPLVYYLMCGYLCDLSDFDTSDIGDPDMFELVEQIKSVTTKESFEEFKATKCDCIAALGYPSIYISTLENKQEIVRSMVKYYLQYRVTAAMVQFTNGINEAGGLWKIIQEHPKEFEKMFTFTPIQLNSAQLQELIEINWSESGSNKRNGEDATVYSWEMFLKNVEDGNVSVCTPEGSNVEMQVSDILQFMTGANRIPPLGFEKKLSIAFFDHEADCKRLPYVSTCALQLFLPRGQEDPNTFTEIMKSCIFGSYGFDKV